MSRSTNEYTPIVLEIGSRFIKVGIAGDSNPSHVIDTSAQHAYYNYASSLQYPPFFEFDNSALTDTQRQDVIDEAQLKNPEYQSLGEIYTNESHKWIEINSGQVASQHSYLHHYSSQISTSTHSKDPSPQDWHLQDLLFDLFRDELSVSPRRCKVILLDDHFSLLLKFKILNILLNKLKVKSVLLTPSPIMSVIGANERDGLVLDFGWESLSITPVVDLRNVSNSVHELSEFGGLSLHYLVILKLMQLNDSRITEELLIREDLFEVIENFVVTGMYAKSKTALGNSEGSYAIVDDIQVPESLRYEVLEASYFSNSALFDSIVSVLDDSNLDTRPLLLKNIIVTGGISNIPGFKHRFLQELESRLSTANDFGGVNTLGPWVGSSLYVSTKLAKADKSVWKENEITRDIINSLTTDNGYKLAGLPDSINTIHKLNR